MGAMNDVLVWSATAVAVAVALAGLASTLARRRIGLVHLAGAAVLVIAAFIPTPWVPLERITTTSGEVQGYVLSVDSGYLNVLTEDHEFRILLSGDVTSRE